MKRIKLDNLITVFFNQSHVFTTSIEKKINSKKSQLICFGLEENGKSLVLRKKVKVTNKSGKVTTHTSRETYFIYIYIYIIFFCWLIETTVIVFCKSKSKLKPRFV